MKHRIKKVLVLGSGAIKIGEAGEFDYSGSQALKALKEDSIETVLVNPNIATIQTSRDMADRLYLVPINAVFIADIIKKEKPDGIFLGFGGQTALNCGVGLWKKGLLARHGVRVLGTPVESIVTTEDRGLFKAHAQKIGIDVPKSMTVTGVPMARAAARKIGYPLILRAAYSLGGQGSTVVVSEKELVTAAEKALCFSSQILLEEYLEGWKEVEYEIVRDGADNCVAVCNMENVDPMGIHTGESIVVAPSQTLNNREYHALRSLSIRLVHSLGIVGECNVQFALDSHSDEYRLIEVNARLSRSSALASKATGYPLAYVAAKLSLGYRLDDLKNSITRATTACFEPALDYVAVKMPRWDLKKFKNVSRRIGSEMKSVGEVMAIGRTFEEALQKAIRMLHVGALGFAYNTNFSFGELRKELELPTDERIFAVAEALKRGWPVARIASLTHIDEWFIAKMKNIVRAPRGTRKGSSSLSPDAMRHMKEMGFSDHGIAEHLGVKENNVTKKRLRWNIVPAVKQIDTLGGEYPAKTNYLYTTYHSRFDDEPAKTRTRAKKVMLLGSGPYKIGSSVEFDWCGVNALRTCRTIGYETIVVNCNPETVSTDYDECDRLYFEELSTERILDIYRKEKPLGVIVSVGGQIPNNLALELERAGVKILGTPARSIHRAEDRHRFSGLLDELGIAQPVWRELTSLASIKKFAREVGYPLLVRPSYVLSGAAMGIAFGPKELDLLLYKALAEVSHKHPVVVSKFISGAKELEIDAVARRGEILVSAITEHVENAGVHSGDATMVFPAQKVYKETEEKILLVARQLARALAITGPFNIQFLAKNNDIMVIECNLRASRSFPFVSKVLDVNFIDLATRAMLGERTKPASIPRPNHVGVKAPQFSFSRLQGSDPMLTVEMTSTGEVACFGESVEEAFMKSLMATGFRMPKKNILLSLGGDQNKSEFMESAGVLREMGFTLYATLRTAAFLRLHNIPCRVLYKPRDRKDPSAAESLRPGSMHLFINTSDEDFPDNIPDDYRMRRIAVDHNIPLFTNIKVAKLFVSSLWKLRQKEIRLEAKSWNDYYR